MAITRCSYIDSDTGNRCLGRQGAKHAHRWNRTPKKSRPTIAVIRELIRITELSLSHWASTIRSEYEGTSELAIQLEPIGHMKAALLVFKNRFGGKDV